MPQVASQSGAELYKVAVGIPVGGAYRPLERCGDVRDNVVGDGVGVLIDVQADRHWVLRGAIRALAHEVCTERKITQAGHTDSLASDVGQ